MLNLKLNGEPTDSADSRFKHTDEFVVLLSFSHISTYYHVEY